MAKMLGRLGWHGQCSCCNGPGWEKRAEEREWRREWADDMTTMDLSIARGRVLAHVTRWPCRCHSEHVAGQEPWCLCSNDYADLCDICAP